MLVPSFPRLTYSTFSNSHCVVVAVAVVFDVVTTNVSTIITSVESTEGAMVGSMVGCLVQVVSCVGGKRMNESLLLLPKHVMRCDVIGALLLLFLLLRHQTSC